MNLSTISPISGQRRGTRLLWSEGTTAAFTRRGNETLVAEGGHPLVAGPLGITMRLGAGAVNLIANPSFEVDAAGWGLNGAGTQSLTRITSDAYSGSACASVTTDGSVGGQGLIWNGTRPAATAGVAYTISGWSKGVSGSSLLRIGMEFYDVGGGFLAGFNTPYTMSSAWTRATFTATAPANTASVRPYYRVHNAVAATYRVDALQLEARAYASTYCDGSLGDGHAWSGTAHASASTRDASRLRGDGAALAASMGGCFAWLRPEWPSTDAGEHVVLHWNMDATHELCVAATGSGTWRARWIDGGVTSSAEVAASQGSGDSLLLAVGWTPRVIMIQIGAARIEVARATSPSTMDSARQFDIGRRSDASSGYADAAIGPIVLLGVPPSTHAVIVAQALSAPPPWGACLLAS